MRKVLIIDTSILCVWLQVPGKETCGSDKNQWNKERLEPILADEEKKKTIFVLPLATIVETGNHIAQAKSKRYEIAQKLAEIITAAVDEKTPWAAFTEQSPLWDVEQLKQLATEWPSLAAQNISLGDATIKKVAEHYAKMSVKVEIITGDEGLKSYEPTTPPKRRRSQS